MKTIEIKEVTKLYGTQKALDGVGFTIDKGEIVGLLGPNGAGKSTLMKIITSFITPDSGTVFINGTDVLEDDIETRKQIGYLPENNPLYPDMYVREYLAFVLKVYKTPFDVKQRVEEMIALTGLTPESHKKIGALSKGYRQRVGLAQALIHDPEILILDEPTSGLDPNQLVDIRNIISEFGKQKTIILSTHIMQEVEAVCDRVVIIHKGKLVADDKTDNLWKIAGTGNYYEVEFKETVEINLLQSLPFVLKASRQSNGKWLLEAEKGEDIREAVFNFATKNGIHILSLSQSEQRMEDVFHSLTAGSM
jgi:ABC-2 type transport system ATP-binding protein